MRFYFRETLLYNKKKSLQKIVHNTGKIDNASWTLHADQKMFEQMNMKIISWFDYDKSAASYSYEY